MAPETTPAPTGDRTSRSPTYTCCHACWVNHLEGQSVPYAPAVSHQPLVQRRNNDVCCGCKAQYSEEFRRVDSCCVPLAGSCTRGKGWQAGSLKVKWGQKQDTDAFLSFCGKRGARKRLQKCRGDRSRKTDACYVGVAAAEASPAPAAPQPAPEAAETAEKPAVERKASAPGAAQTRPRAQPVDAPRCAPLPSSAAGPQGSN